MNHLRMFELTESALSRAVIDTPRKRPRPEGRRAEATRTKPEGDEGGETWHRAQWQRRDDLIVPSAVVPSMCCERTPPANLIGARSRVARNLRSPTALVP